MSMNPWEADLYQRGRNARLAAKPSYSCPYGITQLRERCWWLAGWGDKDIEMTAEARFVA